MKNIFLLPTEKYTDLVHSTSKYGGLFLSRHYSPMKEMGDSYQYIYITSDEQIKDVRPYKGKWQLEQGEILNKFPTYLTDLSECKLVVMTTDPQLIADGVQKIDDEFIEWFIQNPDCEFVEITDDTFTVGEMSKLPLGTRNHKYKIIIPQEEQELLPDFRISKDIFDFVTDLSVTNKEEPRKYPIGGYAPGNYSCRCVTCKKEFHGDKRAVQCEPCAIEMVGTKIAQNSDGYKTEEYKQETTEEAAKIEANDEKHRHIMLDYKDGIFYGFITGANWQAERMFSEQINLINWLQQSLTAKKFYSTDAEDLIKQFKKK